MRGQGWRHRADPPQPGPADSPCMPVSDYEKQGKNVASDEQEKSLRPFEA